MIVDILELPNRYCPDADKLSTMVPCFNYRYGTDDVEFYGREISLVPFIEDTVHKYKTIEVNGSDIVEKIFMIQDQIDLNKSFWTSNQKVYPIQQKVFNMTDAIVGTTIKFVNGITEFCEEVYGSPGLQPTVVDRFMKLKHMDLADLDWNNNPYSVVIPSLDSNLIDSSIPLTGCNFNGYLDAWGNKDRTLKKIMTNRGPDMVRRMGDGIVTDIITSFEPGEGMTNTNPIDMHWSMYNLLMQINDLAVTDVRIEANAYTGEITVAFSSRYGGMFDYSHMQGYDRVTNMLIKMTKTMIQDYFKCTPWTRVLIEKMWSEEIYITTNVACPGRSSSIETFTYVDLPVLLLGTVGLQ